MNPETPTDRSAWRGITLLCLCGILVWLQSSGCTHHRSPLAGARKVPPAVASSERPQRPPQPKCVDPIEWSTIGRSVKGSPLRLARFGEAMNGNCTLIFGAFHGDEYQSAYLVERLVDTLPNSGLASDSLQVLLVPAVNPDGLAKRRRQNANGVDLNRNLRTKNWRPKGGHYCSGGKSGSEPEAQAVMALIERYRPNKIVSIHTMGAYRGLVDYDGPGLGLAQAMATRNGYPVKRQGARAGSLGSYAGVDRGIPTITLELASNREQHAAWLENREALLAAIKFKPSAALGK